MTSATPVASPALPDEAATERAVIRTIAYGDVFEYPLRAVEVHRYLHGVRATADATAVALARCSAQGGPLGHRDGYYTLRGREGLVDLRQARAAHAARLWPAAVRFGHVIAGFPFVRMVAVTGSLVWDNVTQTADVDYLIVTEPGRLWVCRWLVSALRRIAQPTGVLLCPNYMVTTRALLLAERNLYGAYELTRMTPIAGLGTYRRLRRANPWAETYLPNAVEPPRLPDLNGQGARSGTSRALVRLARLGERMLRSPVGTALERYEMAYRIRKRAKKGFARGEASYSPDWYKEHTSGHRQRALTAFDERLRAIEARAP